MSKRSHSPHHRFSFKEPRLDCYKGLKLNKDHVDRRDHTQHLDFFREDRYPEGHRRSPVFSGDHRPFMRYNHSSQEELHRRRPPPRYDMVGYDDHQTLSQPHHREEDRDGHRESSKGSNNWVRSPKSPLRIQREEGRESSTLRFHSDHQQREAKMGRRREEQGGGWDKFRDLSLRTSSHAQNWESGWERGRRNTQSSDGERQREDSHQERSPLFRRQRRKLDDVHEQNGYRNKEVEEQHYAPRDKFGRDAEGSSGPLIIEHDHGFRPHGNPPRERFDEQRDHGSAVGRTRSFHPAERYRISEDKSDLREDASGRRGDGRTSSYPETRRNPVQQGRKSTVMDSKHKGKTSFHPRAEGGGAGAARSHTLESSHGFADLPHQEQSSECPPFLEENYKKPISTKAARHEETRSEPWTEHRARSLDRPLPDSGLDPKMPRQRMTEWNRPKSKKVTVIAEETLTIKVDMNQPVNKNSVLCYSSDRQLSLDLVNVGRQRLDFLPMLEHSGTYRESPMHTGTFAQEIITLVHHVKERYFGGRGITLNERFSAPQKATSAEDNEPEKLTLNQRFSSNQGFNVNVSSLLDEEEPVFSSLLQPVRGPGDLRHDLERRRQERTEGVKITITGGRAPQRPLGPASETSAEYRDDEVDQMEPEGLSHLPAQHRRREFNMESRRGGPHRPLKTFQRINCGFGNQFRLIRRQKKHNF